MKELWALFISAQSNGQGIPTEFLEAKKEELRQKKVRLFTTCNVLSESGQHCVYVGVRGCLMIYRQA